MMCTVSESVRFVWSVVVTVIMIILAIPVLAVCVSMVLIDRNLNGSFYDVESSGDVLLFEHLFWVFDYPVEL